MLLRSEYADSDAYLLNRGDEFLRLSEAFLRNELFSITIDIDECCTNNNNNIPMSETTNYISNLTAYNVTTNATNSTVSNYADDGINITSSNIPAALTSTTVTNNNNDVANINAVPNYADDGINITSSNIPAALTSTTVTNNNNDVANINAVSNYADDGINITSSNIPAALTSTTVTNNNYDIATINAVSHNANSTATATTNSSRGDVGNVLFFQAVQYIQFYAQVCNFTPSSKKNYRINPLNLFTKLLEPFPVTLQGKSLADFNSKGKVFYERIRYRNDYNIVNYVLTNYFYLFLE